MSRGAPAKTVRSVVASADRIAISLNLVPDAAETPAFRAGYLPECGPSPLRFAEAMAWPPPLPVAPAEAAAPEKKPEVSDTAPPETPAEQVAETGDEERPESIVISAGNPPKPRPAGADDRPLLTSDLVLGYLENRPPRQGGIRASFQPATPPEASSDAQSTAAPSAQNP